MYIYSVDRETSKTERARAGRAPASRRARPRGLRDIFFTHSSHTAHSRRSREETDTLCIINIRHATSYDATATRVALQTKVRLGRACGTCGPLYRMRVPASYQLTTEAAGVALGVAAVAAVSVTVLPNRPAIRW